MKINLNVKGIADALLLEQTDYLVKREREITIVILRHLREIEVRRLYISREYSSMHKYCIQHLKYSEGQAQRRIASARLLTELPEIEQQIQDGDLNLTNLSKIQSFVRAEKAANCSLDKSDKLELIASLENKSTREVERELVKKSHQPLLLAEKFRMTEQELTLVTSENNSHTGELSEISYQRFETLLGAEQQDLLQEFKNFYAHELADMSNNSVLIFLLEKAVAHKKKKLGLQIKANNNAPLPLAPKVEGGQEKSGKRKQGAPLRHPIRSSIRKQLWRRAEACCEHVDRNTQKRCDSTFALEEDHIRPVALGGSNELVNLQLLCRAHNSRPAIETFGIFRK
ncbi:HNH endonuclease [Bdellovibrio sp. HCB2-146]|uniref:HNH endonuclease n=1 Tax=Bdellovibrio sp. HCB2-146 TaxID=3394362 RepID=UPI0039BCE508